MKSKFSFPHKSTLFLLSSVVVCSTLVAQNRLKKTDYEYDLISGKVNEVIYQSGKADQLIQKYKYDADNRITEVHSSTDGVIFDKDASYTYYQHGPLARIELGNNKVQGIDYAYNLQGWLKGVNSNALDPLKDIGKDGITASKTARDVFGFSLGYYTNDYAPKGPAGTGDFLANTTSLDPANSSLYNGSIRHMATSIRQPDGNLLPIQGNVYRYDQLNRLKTAQTFTLSTSTNTWASNNEKYKENFEYDANGNITDLKRNGNVGPMDDLDYAYTTVDGKKYNNRLLNVKDGVTNKLAYTNDIDDQAGYIENDKSTWNYQYDEIGNLISDKQEEIAEIEWNVSGKIKSIHRTAASTKPDLEFKYDALGNRIAKIVKPHNHLNNPSEWTTTYYMLDAQGNTLAVYEKAIPVEGPGFSVWLKEQYIYGSKRLGIINRNLDVTNPVAPVTTFKRTLGQKQYELSNHLGNVLATVSDTRTAHDDDHNNTIDYYTAKILTATDYYAFGSPMPDRDFNGTDYRHGFNGKEKDNELKGLSNSYDFGGRMYDPRLGRWLSVDPLSIKYPGWSTYNFTLNNPVLFVDPDGNYVSVTRVEGNGGKPLIKISISIVLIDETKNFSRRQLRSIKREIEETLEKTYSDQGKDIDWELSASVRVGEKPRKRIFDKGKEHSISLVNIVEKGEEGDKDAQGINLPDIGGTVVRVQAGLHGNKPAMKGPNKGLPETEKGEAILLNVVAHEIGHALGLRHPRDLKDEGYKDVMGTPDWMTPPTILKGNVMNNTQGRGESTPGYNVSENQILQIEKNYNSKELNKEKK